MRALLRWLTVAYAIVFLAACAQNFGLRLALGPIDFYFAEPIWQAGVGEGLIGLGLLAAAATERRRVYWAAYGLSVFGILFGLSSARVVGAAREIHEVLVPLAVLGISLLVATRRPSR